MGVELVEVVSPELVDALNELLPQLSRSAPELSTEDVEAIVHQEGVYLFVYRDPSNNRILGTLTLATFRIPTGLRAWIEDVVVLEDARGHGAGQQLVEAATEYAKHVGARSVDLTSRPSREAANRLYARCGFNARETNVYRYSDVD
ncbi:GNAT family N-acetyltransferase [Bowdeniella nasicola]|uniref:GNAT family N-acetyltransferase n=1 Tax=Bowdeniella nasicola TaxID=208480 RepID=A0A1Q5Q092_9ACTO|nr:GNAT family N-acetyltransferase [Bowdeniella nasicola]OKL53197.1 GNAT family N-acetyltransferase [Bowdeniella nasicola]